ncbi:MAG: LamG domain-containing protein, partial [bacterium]
INNKVITSTLNSGWNHIALTYNGTTMKLYINGAQANSQSLSGAITTNSNNLIIGEKFTGRIDEVRIYDRALSAAEIRCHYERRRYAESEPTSTMGSEETSSAIGLQKASATSTYHAEQFLGIALTSGAPGDSIPVRIFGVAQGFSGLTVGADYYLQNAPGRIGTNPGNINKRVGTAIADDKLFISR